MRYPCGWNWVERMCGMAEFSVKPEKVCEFVAYVIETFEDFLERRGIDIPNPEKEESECASLIYGTDYGELQSELEELFMCYKIIPPEWWREL